MLRRLSASFALMLLAGTALAAQSQASSDLWTGTRHLAVAKSTFVGDTPPRERTFVIESIDNGMKATVTGTQADGSTLSFGYTAKFDGKFYPDARGGPGDSVAFRRVGARRLESTQKTGAKIAGTSTFVLSRDGKVVTLTFKGAHGEPGNVLVFEK